MTVEEAARIQAEAQNAIDRGDLKTYLNLMQHLRTNGWTVSYEGMHQNA